MNFKFLSALAVLSTLVPQIIFARTPENNFQPVSTYLHANLKSLFNKSETQIFEAITSQDNVSPKVQIFLQKNAIVCSPDADNESKLMGQQPRNKEIVHRNQVIGLAYRQDKFDGPEIDHVFVVPAPYTQKSISNDCILLTSQRKIAEPTISEIKDKLDQHKSMWQGTVDTFQEVDSVKLCDSASTHSTTISHAERLGFLSVRNPSLKNRNDILLGKYSFQITSAENKDRICIVYTKQIPR